MNLRKDNSLKKVNKNRSGLMDITQIYQNNIHKFGGPTKQQSQQKCCNVQKYRKSSVTLNRSGLQQLSSKVNTSILTDQFTSKIILIKKLQKLEKQAVSLFYEKKTTQCFQNIAKCFTLMGQFELQYDKNCQNQEFFLEHLIYLRYLQTQLYFKLGDFRKSRKEYNCGVSIVSKIKKNVSQKIRHYQMNLKVLNAMLLFQETNYKQSLKCINSLLKDYAACQQNRQNCQNSSKQVSETRIIPSAQKNKRKTDNCMNIGMKLSLKNYQQLQFYQFSSLSKLGQYTIAVQCIQKYLQKYGNINQQNEQITSVFSVSRSPYTSANRSRSHSQEKCNNGNKYKQHRKNISISQKQRVIDIILQCYRNLGQFAQIQKTAVQFITQLQIEINYKLSKQLIKTMENMYNILIQCFQQQDMIKSLYWAQKWKNKLSNYSQILDSDQQMDSINIRLFHLYAQIADFDASILAYSQVSQGYVRNWKQHQLLAQIYTFYGEKQSAMISLEKASELIQSQPKIQTKIHKQLQIQISQIKLSQTQLNETNKQQIKQIQRKIKQNIQKEWIVDIMDQYGEMLLILGEQERYLKFKQIIQHKKNKIASKRDYEIDFKRTGEFGRISDL